VPSVPHKSTLYHFRVGCSRVPGRGSTTPTGPLLTCPGRGSLRPPAASRSYARKLAARSFPRRPPAYVLRALVRAFNRLLALAENALVRLARPFRGALPVSAQSDRSLALPLRS